MQQLWNLLNISNLLEAYLMLVVMTWGDQMPAVMVGLSIVLDNSCTNLMLEIIYSGVQLLLTPPNAYHMVAPPYQIRVNRFQ